MLYKDHAQCDLKTESAFLLTKYSVREYWSSEQICLELKVWMPSFLNIKSSLPEVSYKKNVLKIFAKFIEKYPWCSLHNAMYTNAMATCLVLESTESLILTEWIVETWVYSKPEYNIFKPGKTVL